jgi:hypothetical protein
MGMRWCWISYARKAVNPAAFATGFFLKRQA